MDKKILSVIIPLYEVEEYVAKTAQSVANQAFDGLEVIVVDDGSPDRSFEICMNELRGLDTVSIRQKNMGLSAARNAGINAASGEYILFLDSDDFLLAGAFENFLSILEKEKPDVIFGRYLKWVQKKGYIKSKKYNFKLPENPVKRIDYIIGELPETSWNAWRYICKRELITKQNLLFEINVYCEDIKWTLNLLESAKTISYLSEFFYAYNHRRPGSIMSSMNAKRFIDLNNTVRELSEKYKTRPVICRELINESFLNINLYCSFKKSEKKIIYENYKTVLPLFHLSDKLIHRITGNLNHPALFCTLSIMLNILKHIRQIFVRVKVTPDNLYAEKQNYNYQTM